MSNGVKERGEEGGRERGKKVLSVDESCSSSFTCVAGLTRTDSERGSFPIKIVDFESL